MSSPKRVENPALRTRWWPDAVFGLVLVVGMVIFLGAMAWLIIDAIW
jgi:hypothetical protein